MTVRALVVLLAFTAVQPVLSAMPATPVASAQGAPVGEVPVQATGSAEGRSHRADSDATAGPEDGPARGPGRGEGELPLDERPRPETGTEPDQPRTQVTTGAAPTVAGSSFDPRFSREIVTERDARTRVYANPDGTRTAQISAQPEFYRTPEGSWEPIDTTLVDDGATVRNKAAAIGHRFAKNADSRSLGEYRVRDGVSVGFGVAGAAPVTGRTADDLINYGNIRSHSDIELQSTPTGIKETIVLKSKDAPTEWEFPLELNGLSASLDESGSVLFKDGSGEVKAKIPHGFMEDSAFPEAGTGAYSAGVTYRLDERDGKTVLHVGIDKAWVNDPARVYPIKVDPSVEDRQVDASTFVQTGFVTPQYSMAELRAGTWDGGYNKAATYLNFGSVSSRFAGQYILGAQLWLANIHSFSCSPRDVNVHQVTQPWSADGIAGFPGPGYGALVGSANFSYAYSYAGSTCPDPQWAGIPLNQAGRDLVNSWAHGGANHGLTVRASESDSYAWKKFASRNSANPPQLSVTYSPYWATYQVAQGMTTPISSTQDGVMPVTVTNWGKDVWTPGNNYQLTYHLYDANGVEQPQSATYHVAMPYNVGYGQSATINMPIKKLAPGNWTIRFDMDRYGTTMFASQGVPTSGTVAITIGDQYPIIDSMSPPSGDAVGTLTPVLSFRGHDPDNYPSLGTAGRFWVYNANGTQIADSTWIGDGNSSGFWGRMTWQIPTGTLQWGQTYRWAASIGSWGNNGPVVDGGTFTTVIDQPALLSHAGAAAVEAGRGFDPATRNYTTAATDAVVKTVGPDLSVVRTYNSVDTRTNLAFGAGWSTRYDTGIVPDNDGSGNVVVTYPDGQQVRFGANGNGTFTAPQGRFATLTTVPGGGWKLTDKSATTYLFDSAGKLLSLTDGSGRSVVLAYNSGRLATATNAQGGRSLRFQWTNNHVTAVTTDPVDGTGTEQTWRYTYDGYRLTKACDPTNACTTYDYDPATAYQTRVRNNSRDYWLLNDAASGQTAANQIAGRPALTYNNVTSSTDNPFGTSGTPAAVFNGTSARISGNALTTAVGEHGMLRYSLWFKTSATGGVLLGNSPTAWGGANPATPYPVVYVGTDGRLRASGGSAASTTRVDDGKWHHLDLLLKWAAGPAADLVLDGAVVTSWSSAWAAGNPSFFHVGGGPSKSTWPSAPSAPWSFFHGSIAHLSVTTNSTDHSSPHQAAMTWRLRAITDPGGRKTAEVTYESDGTGQVQRVVDRNGGVWQVQRATGHADTPFWRKPRQSDYQTRLTQADSGWFAGSNKPSTARGLNPVPTYGTGWTTTGTGPFGETVAMPSGQKPVFPGSYIAGAHTKSVELWFKTTTTTGGVLLASGKNDAAHADQSQTVPILYVGTDGKLRGRFRNGQLAAITTTNPVNDGNWHHVVLAAGGGSQTLYLDGTAAGTQSGAIWSSDAHLFVGHGRVDGADWPVKPTDTAGKFAGSLTHLAFYRRALTSGQVGAHYAARTTQAAYQTAVRADVPHHVWTFGPPLPNIDQQVGLATFTSVALDTVPLTENGPSGTFNGTTSHVRLPEYHLSGRSELSADLWFKTGSNAGGVLLGTADRVIGDGTPQAGRAILYVGTDGRLRGRFGAGTEFLAGTDRVNDDQWHHVALVGRGTGQVLYLDGQSVGYLSGGYSDGERHVFAGAGWLAGGDHPARPADDWGRFHGTLSELAFHSRPLTGAEVMDTYRAGRADAHQVKVTDPAGRSMVYGFDHERGDRLIHKSDANGDLRYFQYDTRGFLARVTDANGHSIVTGHDARGNMVSQTTCRTRTRCHTAYFGYHLNPADPADPRNDLLVTARDARSADKDDTSFLTRYAYTAGGDLASVTGPGTAASPEGTVTANQYTTGSDAVPAHAGTGFQPAGLLASTTNPAGGVTSYAYNRFGDLAETTDPAGKKVRFAHDGLGRPISETVLSSALPGGSATTTTTYDGASRVLTTTAPATTDAVTGTAHQARTTNTHNPDGTLASATRSDVAGNDLARVTAYGYDDRGRVASVTDAENGVTHYAYDSLGNVTKVTGPMGNETVHTYTPVNQLATTTVKGFDGDGAPARDVVTESRAYDPAGRLASVTDAMGRTTGYRYFDDGLLASTARTGFRNPDGSRRDITLSTHAYDGAGNETRVETGGVVTERTWDAADNLIRSVGDPSGAARSTSVEYDAQGNPVKVTRTDAAATGTEVAELGYDPVGRPVRRAVRNGAQWLVTTTIRDQSGLPTAVTEPRGNAPGATAADFTASFAYDPLGRVVSQTAPPVSVEANGAAATTARPVTTTGYNTFGETVAAKDANGNVTTTAYDKVGRPTATTRAAYTAPGGTPVTSTTTSAYDKLGRLTSETDAASGVTTYAYDVLGNRTRRTDPAVGTAPAGVSTFRHTPLGELLGATGTTGATLSATYDDLGREITSTVHERHPAPGRNLTTRTSYNDSGTVASVKGPHGAQVEYGYNGLGERVSTKDPAGKITTASHDFAGRVVRVTDPLGLRVDTAYDPAGRAVGSSWLSAAGQVLRTASTGYDAAGNTVSQTDGEGAVTTWQVDALGRRNSETEQVSATASITTAFGYDAAGNQTRFTDGNGNITTTSYNTWNLPESVVEPVTAAHTAASNRTWTTGYDRMGRPTRLAQPGGVVRERTYDVLGNLTLETGSGTSATTRERVLGYDNAGRLTSASAGTGTNAYSYDDRGNLLSMTGPSGDGSYTYDDAARLVRRVDAAGTAEFTYESTGRLKTAIDPRTGLTATYTHDDAGRTTGVGYGTGNGSRSYAYDDLNRVVADTVSNPSGQATASIAYGYDKNDRLTTKATTGLAGAGTSTYTYDKAGRLTKWDDGTNPVTYTWDDNGNRLSAGTVTATYDQRNRLLTSGNSTFDHTARGTLQSTTTGGTTVNHQYDAFDRLITDGTAGYAYDSLDRRIGTGIAYADQSNALAADGTGLYSRLPGGDLLGITQGGASGLAYTDRHTDLIGTYTAQGAVASSAAYNPHGQITARTGATHALGYQSGWTDPVTGRVNMAARWYTPGTGTFAGRDDIAGPSGPGHSGHNRYAYVLGDPLNQTDPTGRWGHCVIAAGAGSAVLPGAGTVVAGGGCVAVTSLILLGGMLAGIGASVSADAPVRPPAPAPNGTGWRPDGVENTPGCRATHCGQSTPKPPRPKCPITVCVPPRPPAPSDTGTPCRAGECRVTPPGPSPEEARRIEAAARILANAMTPLPRNPSGPVLAPEIRKLIEDAGKVVASVVGGQTDDQGTPQTQPGDGGAPRTPPTGTDDPDERCRQNWQHYEDQEEVFWNDEPGERSTGALACVATVNKAKRPKLGLDPFGLDTSKGMARCHLIGHKLNGSNTDPRNFVPCYQDPTNNSWMYHNVEAKIAEQVDGGNPVLMGVKPVYADLSNPIPTSIKIAAIGNDGWTCIVDIPNTTKAGVAANGTTFTGC
ncbi:LamG-like jellyroll fold domain-containing protein [Actinosynnema sp. NPDC050436]|uniref:LamG-like jellyroll fold domain-containing protein n=1 Tax=Actinosynnema sp. NPDC050436 TaxID=3155659 RepID=UPI0033CF2DB8